MNKEDLAEWLKAEIQGVASYTFGDVGDLYVDGFISPRGLAVGIFSLIEDGWLR